MGFQEPHLRSIDDPHVEFVAIQLVVRVGPLNRRHDPPHVLQYRLVSGSGSPSLPVTGFRVGS